MGVGVLQGGSNLLDVGHRCGEREAGTTRVTLAQGALARIVHGQKRDALFHSKVVDAHNMRMVEASEQLRLGEEGVDIFVFQRGMQDFEGGTAFEIDMLAQIDLCEAASSKQAQQAIVAQLLTNAIGHG